ncbi:hypothetical protein [Bifidobacterium magnum]|uniref:Uncharacterized protein n=1 Tax=Bifidobacterium magnum TaxID=1692 RepID=A0A087B692_9BIFI|nr:hypothetical protein [Bifidobacterium magnum]KFI66542.1 hypothetical protein BMAGN_1450 [Bifidobacterium magnum]
MDNIFETLAIDVRDAIDAEQLIFDLVERTYPCEGFEDVSLYTYMDLDTTAMADQGRVILFQVTSPQQINRMFWKFTVSFTVLGATGNGVDVLARDLYRRVKHWPLEEGTDAGSLGKIVDIDAPRRFSDAKENAGKSVSEYAFDVTFTARDPY